MDTCRFNLHFAADLSKEWGPPPLHLLRGALRTEISRIVAPRYVAIADQRLPAKQCGKDEACFRFRASGDTLELYR